MAQNSSFTPPPIPQASELAQGSAVRRHHTISNPGRMGGRIAERRDSEEAVAYEEENDDQWTGGSALASEKQASLQRNLSLPSKYHRALRDQDQPGLPSSGLAHSKSVGGLSSLNAGPEDEEWSGVAATMYENDEVDQLPTSQTNPDNIHSTSPPTASGTVRRHVSMTDGRVRRGTPPRRYPTVSGRPPMRSSTMDATTEAPDDYAAGYAEGEAEEYDDSSAYGADLAYGGLQQGERDATTGTDPTWRNNVAGNTEWKQSQNQVNVDELANTLGNLDIQQAQQPNYARGGPRFDATVNTGYQDSYSQQLQQARQSVLSHNQRLGLNNEASVPTGPVSTSAFVPHQGHTHHGSIQRESIMSISSGEDHHRAASGEWDQKSRILKGRGSNPNLGQGFQEQYGAGGGGVFGGMPPPPPIPAQYLNQIQAGRLASGAGSMANFGTGPVQQFGTMRVQPHQALADTQNPPLLDPAAFLASPIDVPAMIAQKGYNPATFDTKPAYARYFVIKSYTEDDVHKSLKYEIWSSTDPGNKRLDKAFRECAGKGPIYLFFSVNASGHFCGMAEMLTPVDYTRSSTVWASDKWKGVFKVRWIFVRDIPNSVLRNIRLNNTQERKPVTNSRDTQELLPEAGHEMLRIFFTHPAKTSLLQDFAFYELQSLQKQQQQAAQQAALGSPQAASPAPAHATPQHIPYSMSTQTHIPYSPPQPGHSQQLQNNQGGLGNVIGPVGRPMGSGHAGVQVPNYGNAIGLGIGPQVAQSVLRDSSPRPINSGVPNPNYLGQSGGNNSGIF